MRKLMMKMSISVDGFGTGEGLSLDEPFGHAGERLHEWMFLTRRGVRLWDGLEGLDSDYVIEATSSPSGVTHLMFTRAGPDEG